MKLLDRFKKLRAGQRALIIIAILIVSIGGWITYDNIRPRPLGEEMVYLGKIDSGGGIFYRDYAPYSVYYYGTDIAPEQLIEQFKDTSLQHPIEDNGQYTDVWLESISGETFSLTYKKDNSFKTEKKYIVSILDEDYMTARQHLK
jgi:hypothetical protein